MTAPLPSLASAALPGVEPPREEGPQAPGAGSLPPCATCGRPPEIIPRQEGVLLMWHRCEPAGYSVGWGPQDMDHARELWAGHAQERAR